MFVPFLFSPSFVGLLLDLGMLEIAPSIKWEKAREFVEPEGGGKRRPIGSQLIGPGGTHVWQITARMYSWNFDHLEQVDVRVFVESEEKPTIGETGLDLAAMEEKLAEAVGELSGTVGDFS